MKFYERKETNNKLKNQLITGTTNEFIKRRFRLQNYTRKVKNQLNSGN